MVIPSMLAMMPQCSNAIFTPFAICGQKSSFHKKIISDNIILMGDFNADCSYVPKTKLKKLALRSKGFHWLIPDEWDTTVASTNCAYDRLGFSINIGDFVEFISVLSCYINTVSAIFAQIFPIQNCLQPRAKS